MPEVRVRELVRRYADLPLGFADAAVTACAERHRGRVLTTDYRHFPVVARGEKTTCPAKPSIDAFVTRFADADYELTGLTWSRYVAKAPKGWERFEALKQDGNDVLLFNRSP